MTIFIFWVRLCKLANQNNIHYFFPFFALNLYFSSTKIDVIIFLTSLVLSLKKLNNIANNIDNWIKKEAIHKRNG